MMTRTMPAHGKGGLEDHTMTLCRGLVKKGHEVVVITTKHPDTMWNLIHDGKNTEVVDGVTIHYLPNTRSRDYHGGYWRESAKNIWLNIDDFDVIHSQSAACYGLFDIDKDKRPPIVVSLHGTFIDEIQTQKNIMKFEPSIKNFLKGNYLVARAWWNYFNYDRVFVNGADAVIATSNEQFDIITKNYDAKAVFKVYNGIDADKFVPKHRGPGYLILCMARLEVDKGIQYAIRAMPLVLKNIPYARLVIVGDGSYRKKLEKLADKLCIAHVCWFVGMVEPDKLSEHFNSCDVFVNPTIRQNGYDLSIMEAMACGLSVIVSNIGSVPTLINDGENGMLVEPGDYMALHHRIESVLNNLDGYDHIRESARKTIVNRFNIDQMVEGTLKVYREAIRNKVDVVAQSTTPP